MREKNKMKILVIGNSFGTDCTRYLHSIARGEGKDFKVVNLYIGGCSLYRHYRNMMSEDSVYEYQINGYSTGLFVSLKQALLMDEWDVVMTQQCSPDSGEPETYEPYDTALVDYVRTMVPHVQFWVHQTWTFEHNAPRFKLTSYSEPASMLEAIVNNYRAMAKRTHAYGIIPNGEAMFALYMRRNLFGIEKVHRDGFHADYGCGRYLLALVTYAVLTESSVAQNKFRDFDVPVSEQQAQAVCLVADEVANEYIKSNLELRG